MAGVDRTGLGVVTGIVLPSPQQVAELRTFIDGRTYAALGVTIRLPDDPPLAPGSGLVRAKEVRGAFFSQVARLAELLQAELRSGGAPRGCRRNRTDLGSPPDALAHALE